MAQLQNNTYMSSIQIHLNSNYATQSYASNHKKFQFRDISPPPKSHLMIALSDFSMPYSFYLFESGKNNTFDIEIDSVTTTITIPEGNYTTSTFLKELNGLISDLNIIAYANYKTYKIYFKNTSLATITFKNISCFRILGFESEDPITFSLSTFYLPNVFNFSGTSQIYIRTIGLALNNINSGSIDSIIESIDCNVYPSEIIYYNPNEINYFRLNSNINHLEIQILDENFESIQLNGSNFKATFCIHFSKNIGQIEETAPIKTITKVERKAENLLNFNK